MASRVRIALTTRVSGDTPAGVVATTLRDELRTVILSALWFYYPIAIAENGASQDEVEQAIRNVQFSLNRLADEARVRVHVETKSDKPAEQSVSPEQLVDASPNYEEEDGF